MSRVLVTGGAGTIGAAVVRRLTRDGEFEVRVSDQREAPDWMRGACEVHTGNLLDPSEASAAVANCAQVIHLAAIVGGIANFHKLPHTLLEVNNGLYNAVFRAALDAGVERLVYVSSSMVFERATEFPTTEEHLLDCPAPRSAYGRTKAAGERLALDAGAVVLRPRAVYGPGDPHLLPRLRRVVRGGRALLPGPDIPLSLTAVENLADACLAAAHWPSGAYNVADAVAYRRDEVVGAAFGVPVTHVPVPLVDAAVSVFAGATRILRRPAVLTRYAVEQLTSPLVLDISRARAQGWTPRRSFADYLSARRPGAGP